MKLITDILTGIDNKTFDHGRVMSLVSFFSYFVYAGVSLIMQHPWGAMDFAGGISAIAIGFGIHLKLKSDTEPQA